MSGEGAEIVRVAARGEGVTADGRHVPLAAPGDRVLADGSIVPGPAHQAPPCRHFPGCGGCDLQHLNDAAYADFVRDRVLGALAAQGLTATVRPAILSPPASRRRARLHAERRGGVVLGYSERGSHRLVDLKQCPVLAPDLAALIAPLRRLLGTLLPPRRRADVVMTRADQGIDLLLHGVSADDLASTQALTDFAGAHGLARLSLDTGLGPEVRWEPVGATITLGGVAVPLPHDAFLQPTLEGEAALLAAAQEALGEVLAAKGVVADLFAGLGTFALSLGTRVYAAEAARDAVLALKAAAGRAQRPVVAEHRDLYRRPLQREELDRFAAVLLDPPRAGAREQAATLAQSSVPVIAYVSCNPSSFARDVKILCENGYALDWVQPVGQFRWSTHVELAARLVRR
ncbi:MAG: class I SAM-dependent RNA methyltransferase [Sphingomonas sp.]|nr:class I SAM-dependent RNA methyltransferase [Sphingomonas sp.]MBX9795615.1 class I SAM-dependent RNA methyltransferase [Sphingomonas sp.]